MRICHLSRTHWNHCAPSINRGFVRQLLSDKPSVDGRGTYHNKERADTLRSFLVVGQTLLNVQSTPSLCKIALQNFYFTCLLSTTAHDFFSRKDPAHSFLSDGPRRARTWDSFNIIVSTRLHLSHKCAPTCQCPLVLVVFSHKSSATFLTKTVRSSLFQTADSGPRCLDDI